MSGNAIKLKVYSYSASPASNCTDKIVNFINKHMHKPTVTSMSCIPYNQLKNLNFGNKEPEKKDESKPQAKQEEQIINNSTHKNSYIDDKHLPCLKEEIMKLEAKKKGKSRIVAAYYTWREMNPYSKYLMKSEAFLRKANKYAKVGVYAGAVYGAVTIGAELVLPGIIAGASAGFGVCYLVSYPSMLKDLARIRKSIVESQDPLEKV